MDVINVDYSTRIPNNVGLTEDLVRARVSLKWNAWGAPVVAKF